MISSGEKGNLPNASIIIKNDFIAGQSESLVATNKDATAHAERLAIEQVCKKNRSPLIPEHQLVSVIEPCLMCLAAAYWAGIKKIYYIIPASKYWDKIPWITESKTVNKNRLVEKFLEKVRYKHLAEFEDDFCKIFNKYVDKVIPREIKH